HAVDVGVAGHRDRLPAGDVVTDDDAPGPRGRGVVRLDLEGAGAAVDVHEVAGNGGPVGERRAPVGRGRTLGVRRVLADHHVSGDAGLVEDRAVRRCGGGARTGEGA